MESEGKRIDMSRILYFTVSYFYIYVFMYICLYICVYMCIFVVICIYTKWVRSSVTTSVCGIRGNYFVAIK